LGLLLGLGLPRRLMLLLASLALGKLRLLLLSLGLTREIMLLLPGLAFGEPRLLLRFPLLTGL